MNVSDPPEGVAVLEIDGVVRNYGGLRPLRIRQLVVGAAERVALLGFDQVAAEMFVNLVTGQSLPDTGEIRLFGRATREISDSRDWLHFVDQFGIVSQRAVVLEPLTVGQNLAMPFTLSVEPLADEIREKAASLAREIGLNADAFSVTAGSLDAAAKMRLRLGRALALGPSMLLLEHASAGLSPADAAALGSDIAAIAGARGIAAVALTVDEPFARSFAHRVLRWDAASGRLSSRGGWFGRRFG